MSIIRNNSNGFGNDSHCKVLIHGSETYTTNPFVDSSGYPHDCGFYGTNPPAFSSVSSSLGSKSIYFAPTTRDNYVNVGIYHFDDEEPTYYMDWSYEGFDFTEDLWVYYNSSFPMGYSALGGIYSDISNYRFLYVDNAGGNLILKYEITSGGSVLANISGSLTGIFDAVKWHHIAVVRHNNIISLYVNGSNIASGSFVGSIPTIMQYYHIGNISTLYGFTDGFIDEFRISKGIARWKSNFKLPNREY